MTEVYPFEILKKSYKYPLIIQIWNVFLDNPLVYEIKHFYGGIIWKHSVDLTLILWNN
jgi:hypothetical protein